MKTIRALHDKVAVEVLTVTPNTGKIVIPQAYRNDRHFGRIVSIGYKRDEHGNKYPCLDGARVGDIVRYQRAGAWIEIELNGKTVAILNSGYIEAVIEGAPEVGLEDHSMQSYVR